MDVRSRCLRGCSSGTATWVCPSPNDHSNIAVKLSAMPSSTTAYTAMAMCESSAPLVRYVAIVAVANGISTTNSSNTRLMKSSVLSTTAMRHHARVMVDPDDPDREEAHRIGRELRQQVAVPRLGNGEVERQQRDGHGDDDITEGLEACLAHLSAKSVHADP